MVDRNRRVLDSVLHAYRRVLSRSRALTVLALLAAALVWAIARGLNYYGISPVGLAYDLDQPPALLLLVSAWLLLRTRRQ